MLDTVKSDWKKALIDTIPVMTGYIFLGIGFGILLRTNGFGIGWAFAMSLFIYAGSLQYVGIEMLTGATSLVTVALTSLMVNARHLFYGISMIDKYKGMGRRKPYLIFALTDETYSLVCKRDRSKTQESYYFLVSLLDQIYWVTGSVIGSVLGGIIKFNTEGIDFALTALFITVFTEQWMNTKQHIPAIIGVVASVVSLIIFGADDFLIPSMILIAASLVISRKKLAVSLHN